MGTVTRQAGRGLTLGLAALATAGLTAACGGGSTPNAGTSASATPTATANPTASGLARFKAVATGPLFAKLQTDLAKFAADAAKPDLAAAESDARQVATDITAWAEALRAVDLPPAYQMAKTRLLRGLDLMSKGVTEVADGIHNNDTSLIDKGNADVQAGVKLIRQAQAEIP